MALLDVLGRRWSLRVLWELRGRTLTFRDLRDRCDAVSPSVLNRRLAELRQAEIIRHDGGGYRLTAWGDELLEVFGPVNDWAKRWGKRRAT